MGEDVLNIVFLIDKEFDIFTEFTKEQAITLGYLEKMMMMMNFNTVKYLTDLTTTLNGIVKEYDSLNITGSWNECFNFYAKNYLNTFNQMKKVFQPRRNENSVRSYRVWDKMKKTTSMIKEDLINNMSVGFEKGEHENNPIYQILNKYVKVDTAEWERYLDASKCGQQFYLTTSFFKDMIKANVLAYDCVVDNIMHQNYKAIAGCFCEFDKLRRLRYDINENINLDGLVQYVNSQYTIKYMPLKDKSKNLNMETALSLYKIVNASIKCMKVRIHSECASEHNFDVETLHTALSRDIDRGTKLIYYKKYISECTYAMNILRKDLKINSKALAILGQSQNDERFKVSKLVNKLIKVTNKFKIEKRENEALTTTTFEENATNRGDYQILYDKTLPIFDSSPNGNKTQLSRGQFTFVRENFADVTRNKSICDIYHPDSNTLGNKRMSVSLLNKIAGIFKKSSGHVTANGLDKTLLMSTNKRTERNFRYYDNSMNTIIENNYSTVNMFQSEGANNEIPYKTNTSNALRPIKTNEKDGEKNLSHYEAVTNTQSSPLKSRDTLKSQRTAMPSVKSMTSGKKKKKKGQQKQHSKPTSPELPSDDLAVSRTSSEIYKILQKSHDLAYLEADEELLLDEPVQLINVDEDNSTCRIKSLRLNKEFVVPLYYIKVENDLPSDSSVLVFESDTRIDEDKIYE